MITNGIFFYLFHNYLYLCSENHIIDEVKVSKSLGTKKTSSSTVSYVGVRVGRLLRAQRVKRQTSEKTGKSVVGHVRKAHWHHFWTGPLTGERKLVLKWVSSVIVNGGEKEAKITEVI